MFWSEQRSIIQQFLPSEIWHFQCFPPGLFKLGLPDHPNRVEFHYVRRIHQYLNCLFALQYPKYSIYYHSRRTRIATTGGSPGWCLLKLQQKSLANWNWAFRSEERCKVSVMKCTNTPSPNSSGARSLYHVFLHAYFSSNNIQSLLDYTVYLLCLVGTLICFKLPKCSLWNA